MSPEEKNNGKLTEGTGFEH